MQNVKRYPLGRYKSDWDGRDWNAENFIPLGALKAEEVITEKHWDYYGDSLDQGETPHCTGFGDATYLINEPTYTPSTDEDGHRFYYMNKEFDGEPGQENGSCVRSAAKTLQAVGRISNYAFAPNFELIKWWLLHRGPVCVGTIWYMGMFTPDEDNIIYPTGTVEGGHFYVLNGIDPEYVYGQNSWGPGWGDNGAFRMRISDFISIFQLGGEASVAVELENSTTIKKLNVIELIINWIISLLKGELK